jgi:hypothetical protein
MVYISNMIDDLKITNQSKFVLNLYKSICNNWFIIISMDVQMQSMCKYILERFNLKLKSINLDGLATY